MSRLPEYTLRSVGLATVVVAVLGLWYTKAVVVTRFPDDPSTPYFHHALYSMSAVYGICYLMLLVIGIHFIRGRRFLVRVFVGVVVFELTSFFIMALLGAGPVAGSISAAGVVAGAGLMFQFLSGFVLWGPLLAHWAKRRLETPPEDPNRIRFRDDEIARSGDWAWAAVNFVVMLALTSLLVALAWDRLGPGGLRPGLVTLGIPILLSSANALLSVRLRRKRRRERIERKRAARLSAGLCPRCEYNLTGLAEPRCPECGAEFDSHSVGAGPTGM